MANDTYNFQYDSYSNLSFIATPSTSAINKPGLVSLQSFVDSNYHNTNTTTNNNNNNNNNNSNSTFLHLTNSSTSIMPHLTNTNSNSNIFAFHPHDTPPSTATTTATSASISTSTIASSSNEYPVRSHPLATASSANMLQLQDFKFTPRCLTPLNFDYNSLLFPISSDSQQQQEQQEQQEQEQDQKNRGTVFSKAQAYPDSTAPLTAGSFTYPQQPSKLSNTTYNYYAQTLPSESPETDTSLSPHLNSSLTYNSVSNSNSTSIDTSHIMFADTTTVSSNNMADFQVLLPSQNLDNLSAELESRHSVTAAVGIGVNNEMFKESNVILKKRKNTYNTSDFDYSYNYPTYDSETDCNGDSECNHADHVRHKHDFTESSEYDNYNDDLSDFDEEDEQSPGDNEDDENDENDENDDDEGRDGDGDGDGYEDDDAEYNSRPPSSVSKSRRRNSNIKTKKSASAAASTSKRTTYTRKLEKQFKCKKCSSSFTRKTRLTEHINRVHLGKVLQFKCDQCGTRLSSKENLTRHSIVHTDKFKCGKCNRRFDRSYRFQRHLEKCGLNH